MPDLLQSISNLQQGRVSDPSQDRLYANDPRAYPTLDPQARLSGQAQAIPFGSLADPISLLASLLAPSLSRGIKGVGQAFETAPPTRQLFSSQRGSIPELRQEFTKRIEGIKDKPTINPIDRKQFIQDVQSGKDFRVASEVSKAQALKPKTTLQKAVSILDDYKGITKDIFKDEFTTRYGSIDAKNIDRLWEYFKFEGVVSDKVDEFGYNVIPEGSVQSLLKELFSK